MDNNLVGKREREKKNRFVELVKYYAKICTPKYKWAPNQTERWMKSMIFTDM